MRVLVTGATGFVGAHLVAHLAKRGHRCVAFGRRVTPASEGIIPFQGDVLDRQALRKATEDCEAVVHLVGIIREFPSQGVTFERLHVEATANVVEVCKEQGISLLVHMSALGASHHSKARYHQTKYAAEELVKRSGVRFVIFRPSLIIGPGSAFVMDMRRMLSLPITGVLSADYRLQPVAIDDVVRAFAASLEDPLALRGETWELCGPQVFTLRELLETMAAVWGKRPRFFPVPPAAMRLAAALLDRFSWFPVTREQLTMLKEGSTCQQGGVFKLLGMEPTPVTRVLALC